MPGDVLDRHPGDSNWVDKTGGLPRYIHDIAESLVTKRGMSVSRAIATAVATVKRWARGGGDVTAQTRAKAVKAVAEWEAKKARARATDLANGNVASDAAMVAVYPPREVAEAVAVADGVAVGDVHVTLVYLGEGLAAATVRDVLLETAAVAKHAVPLTGQVGGLGVFPPGPDGAPVWVPVDVPGLAELRFKLAERLTAAGVGFPRDHGYTPHMTRTYLAAGDKVPAPVPATPVRFGELAVVVGGRRLSLPFGRPIDLANVVDLAPGDGKPPYDWKHGYIPITVAAALSKAKGDKARAAELLAKGPGLSKQAAAKAVDDHTRGRSSSQQAAHDREMIEWRNRRHQAARGTLEPTAADLTWAAQEWKRRNPGEKIAGHDDEVQRLARTRAQDKTDKGQPRTSDAEEASERERVKRAAGEVQRTAKRLAAEKNTEPRQVDAGTARRMSDEQLDAAMGRLMESGAFDSPAMDVLAAEMDSRQTPTVEVAEKPDPHAEADALNALLYGDSKPRDLTRERIGGGRQSREQRLRRDYDEHVWAQYMAAEQATNGHMLTREGRARDIDPLTLFNGRARADTVRKYASPEVLEWLAQPGHGRVTFAEFRGGEVDDKASRRATQRRKERTLSEYGG